MGKKVLTVFLTLVLTVGTIIEVPAAITQKNPFGKDAYYNNSTGKTDATTYCYYKSPEYCLETWIVYSIKGGNTAYKIKKAEANVTELKVKVDIGNKKFAGICTKHIVRRRGEIVYESSIALIK